MLVRVVLLETQEILGTTEVEVHQVILAIQDIMDLVEVEETQVIREILDPLEEEAAAVVVAELVVPHNKVQIEQELMDRVEIMELEE